MKTRYGILSDLFQLSSGHFEPYEVDQTDYITDRELKTSLYSNTSVSPRCDICCDKKKMDSDSKKVQSRSMKQRLTASAGLLNTAQRRRHLFSFPLKPKCFQASDSKLSESNRRFTNSATRFSFATLAPPLDLYQ